MPHSNNALLTASAQAVFASLSQKKQSQGVSLCIVIMRGTGECVSLQSYGRHDVLALVFTSPSDQR